MLREVDSSCTSEESQIMPAVLQMNIHKNPAISQSLSVTPALVRWDSQMHPKFSLVLQRASKLITITPIVLLYQSSEIPVTSVPVIGDPSYSEGRPEYPPRVWYSPEIDASKFALHILSDTTGVFQRLKYILLMYANLPDTPVALTSASKYFQMLPAPPGALQSALRLCTSILTCFWKHLQRWRCIQDAMRFDY